MGWRTGDRTGAGVDKSNLGAVSGEEGDSGGGIGVVDTAAGGAGSLEDVGGEGAWVWGTSPL